MKRTVMIEIICCLLILLFLYTVTSKMVDFRQFRFDMYNQPFPRWMSSVLIWAIPATEILIVLLIMFGKTRLAGLYLSLSLLSLFTVYTLLILARVFDRIPCSCGGVVRLMDWKQHLVFNLVFILLTIIAVMLHRSLSTTTITSPFAAGSHI